METKSYRLHSMPRAQCHVLIGKEDDKAFAELVSYTTSVLFIEADSALLRVCCSGTYSTTTARHINRFTAEFLGRSHYYESKEAVKHGHSTDEHPYYALVAEYPTNSPEYDRMMQTIDNYLHDSFGYGAVRKFYGRY